MKGLIFSIKKYAIHDGPGIRVTFFMKGCPMSCWWCHNPEGISAEKTIVERVDRIGDKEFRKMEPVGKEYTVDQIVEIADRESVFFEHSGGGITFSGGEPMLQAGFLKEALVALRNRNYNTAIDTSGYASPESYAEVIPFTSLFLFDLKLMNDKKHQEFTGVSNSLVITNYRKLAGSGVDIIVRVPIIPGFNDDEDNLKSVSQFIADNMTRNLLRVDLLPFHRIGSSKYSRFGLPYRMGETKQPSHERMIELSEYFSGLGVKVKIGG
jgi:pyruvate formate lyase activating enzyme